MTKLSKRIRQAVARASRDRKGSISVLTGLTMTGVLGLAGLGTEASYWWVQKRNIQGGADAAAFSAGAALMNNESISSNTPTDAALNVLKQYGLTTANATITVNLPPQAGAYLGNTQAAEVIIQQPQPRLFSALFLSSNPIISGRAVALVKTTDTTPACVMALDPGAVSLGAVDVSGGVKLNMPSCDMLINSSAANAYSGSGTATVDAHATFIVGGESLNGSTMDNAPHGPPGSQSTDAYTNQGTPYQNPFGSDSFTMPTTCDQSASTKTISTTTTLNPGTYCGGIKITAGTVTLNPGTYYMKGGDTTNANHAGLNMSGGTLTGQGVTIVLTGTTGNYATVQITGGTVTLDTTTLGPLDGLAFFQDPNAPQAPATGLGTSTTTNNFASAGTANLNIGGGIYFPNQLVKYSGAGTPNNAASCTELVGYQINISGNTTFNSSAASCNGLGSSLATNATVSLVE